MRNYFFVFLLLIQTTCFLLNAYSQTDTDNDGLTDENEILLIGSEFQCLSSVQSGTYLFGPKISSNGTNYFLMYSSYINAYYKEDITGWLLDSEENNTGISLRINSYTERNQYDPSIISNGTTYLVTWTSENQDGSNKGIYGQFFDNQRNPSGVEFQINTYTIGTQTASSIASDGTNYLVTWESIYDERDFGIYGQLYDTAGNSIGTEFQINSFWTIDDISYHSVTSNGTNYLVTFFHDAQHEIYGQILDNYGNTVISKFLINQRIPANAKATVASDGVNYLVVWESILDGEIYGNGSGVYGQLYDNEGNIIKPEFPINTYLTNDQRNPAVASNGITYLVTWDNYNFEDAQNGIYRGISGQLYDNEGNAISVEFQVNANTSCRQVFPAVASNGTNYLVAWVRWEGMIRNIYGQFIKSFGYGTDPLNPDMDNDGLKDGEEIYNYNTSPIFSDSDNDGLKDGEEIYNYNTDPLDADTDNDGMHDGCEIFNDLNPFINDAVNDIDNDGLLNIEELEFNTNPYIEDTDNDGIKDGEEILLKLFQFHINTYTTGEQRYPSVASNGTTYLVTWSSHYQQDGFGSNIYGQLYNNAGDVISEEFRVNTYTTNFQEYPSIASNGSTYLVTWKSYNFGYGIYGQLYDYEGNRMGEEFQVDTYHNFNQQSSAVGSNGETYLVIWSSQYQDGSLYGIYGQLYDNEGDAIGTEFKVNTFTTNSQSDPSVASNGSTYFVTWSSEEQDGSSYGIYGQLYDNEGNAIGTEFQVNTFTANSQSDPSVASNGSTYFVTWSSEEQDGSSYGIYGQLYDNEGDAIGTEFQVNTFTTNSQRYPTIASSDTNYLVTWSSLEQDGSSYGIYGQLYSNDGDTIGIEFQINTFTTYDQQRSSVASNGITFFVTWEGAAVFWQAENNHGIYGQFVKSWGYGTDPINSDMDNDGLNDGNEIHAGTGLLEPDTDFDEMLDGWEVESELNPLVNDANLDSDNDGLDNIEEYRYNTKPNNSDTDNDGMNDGDEIKAGMEPDNSKSLFSIVYCGYSNIDNAFILQWQGSLSYPDISYQILWRDNLLLPWEEVIIDPVDLYNDNGCRIWIDDGDNDSTPPRPAPETSTLRFYKVIVE